MRQRVVRGRGVGKACLRTGDSLGSPAQSRLIEQMGPIPIYSISWRAIGPGRYARYFVE